MAKSKKNNTPKNTVYEGVNKGFIKRDREHNEIYNSTVDHLAPHIISNYSAHLTTNHGLKISDNQNTLKAGFRGPAC